MFANRRQATLGNINLGSLSGLPSYQDLQFVVEQAGKYKGRFVEITWAVAKTGATFQLTAKYVQGQPQPMWMLYRGVGGSSELVWGHHSNDLTLMHNLVMLECDRPVDGGNSISASAFDGMIDMNRSAGAVANAPHESIVQPQPAQPPAQSAAPATGGPAATWLQNLNYGQTATKPAEEQSPAAAPPDHHTNVAPTTGLQSPSPTADAMPPAATAIATATAPPDATTFGADQLGQDLLLEGSLTNITVPKLLRYLTNNHLTGRLSLQSSMGAGEIFLRGGNITHAATLDSKAEAAVLDAATWNDGQFHFYPDEQTGQSTVNTATAELVLSCERMLDIGKFLAQSQVNPGSYLIPNQQQLGRAQFEQMVQKSIPVDLLQLWRMYMQIDGNRTLFDVLRGCPMTRSEWMPSVFVLLNSGLISPATQPLQARPGMFLEGAPIDQASIDAFIATLADITDGILKRDAFLYMLQQEHHRHERTGSRYALAVFSFATTNMLDGNVSPFPKEWMREAGARIMKRKRKLDLVGHFDDNDYALLMPETDSAGAVVFAHRIAEIIQKPMISPDIGDQVLVTSFGIASVPDDVRELSSLLAAVRAAKSRSKMMGAPICVYGET